MSFHKVSVLVIFLILLLALVVPVSADTLTVYTIANENDGRVTRDTDGNFTSFVTGTGESYNTDLVSTNNNAYLAATASESGTYSQMHRYIDKFDTSSLPDDATIDSAIIGVWGIAKSNLLGTTALYVVYMTDQGAVVDQEDYQKVGTLEYGKIEYADFSITGYNNITLNAAALANISKTGNTSLAFTLGWDVTKDDTDIVWAASNTTYYRFYDSYGYAGTSRDPFLQIEYTPSGDTTPPESVTNLTNSTLFCNSAVFSWTNPPSDYNYAYTLKDGVPNGNISSPASSVYWAGLSSGEHTISIQTVDLALNMNATMVNQTVDITKVCPIPMGTIYNNATNLSISTYDGSGELTHPCVVYSAAGWNGYNYLMATSPLRGGSSEYENPSMRYSNDGYTWEQIAGQPDPIIAHPEDGFWSDPNIALNGSTLYLFYRYVNDAQTIIYYNYTTTTDGVTWTDPITFNMNRTRSSSFLYNGTGWESWGHNGTSNANLKHYVTSDFVTWTESGTISGIDIDGGVEWHSEVKLYDDQYQLLMMPTGGDALYYFNSSNGLSWVSSESNPVLTGGPNTWDDELYKSSFFESEDIFRIWYSAYSNTTPQVWYVGYAEYPNNGPPIVASFTANTTSGTVPLAVGFTDTSTNTPTSWNWSFGDGNWSNGTSSAVSYLYEYPGTYNAFLIASNGGGSSTSATTAITVSSGTVPRCEDQTGNITLSLFFNSTTSLGWTWNDPVNITKIAEDGLYVLSFDNSSDYFIGMGYSPESWHKLKIYNETDFGQLNCTTDAVPVTPTPIPIMPSTESTAGSINLIQYWWIVAGVLGIIILFKRG